MQAKATVTTNVFKGEIRCKGQMFDIKDLNHSLCCLNTLGLTPKIPNSNDIKRKMKSAD